MRAVVANGRPARRRPGVRHEEGGRPPGRPPDSPRWWASLMKRAASADPDRKRTSPTASRADAVAGIRSRYDASSRAANRYTTEPSPATVRLVDPRPLAAAGPSPHLDRAAGVVRLRAGDQLDLRTLRDRDHRPHLRRGRGPDPRGQSGGLRRGRPGGRGGRPGGRGGRSADGHEPRDDDRGSATFTYATGTSVALARTGLKYPRATTTSRSPRGTGPRAAARQRRRRTRGARIRQQVRPVPRDLARGAHPHRRVGQEP